MPYYIEIMTPNTKRIHKLHGRIITFETKEEAENEARRLEMLLSPDFKVLYCVKYGEFFKSLT